MLSEKILRFSVQQDFKLFQPWPIKGQIRWPGGEINATWANDLALISCLKSYPNIHIAELGFGFQT